MVTLPAAVAYLVDSRLTSVSARRLFIRRLLPVFATTTRYDFLVVAVIIRCNATVHIWPMVDCYLVYGVEEKNTQNMAWEIM